MSDLIGRSPSYVHKLESGTLDPCAGAFARMAVAMDLSPHEAWVALRLLAAEDEERVTVTPPLYDEHSLVTAERSV